MLDSNDSDRITRQLGQLIRIGVVSSIDPAKHTARVCFEEDGNIESYDLQVLARNSFANKDYNMPDLNEDVLCVFLPQGPENGFIIGAVYAGEVTTPTSNADIRMVQFNDDTRATYNRASHELDVVIAGTHTHADRQTVDVTTPSSINLTTGGNISIKASGTIDVNAGGALTINGATVSIN